MRNFCTTCGKAIASGAGFCGGCGRAVGLGVQQAPIATLAPPPSIHGSFRGPQPWAPNPMPNHYAYAPNEQDRQHQPAVQIQVINALTPHLPRTNPDAGGTYGLPVPSLVIGIITALALSDNNGTQTLSAAESWSASLAWFWASSASAFNEKASMAVAGVVLCSIGLLGFFERLA